MSRKTKTLEESLKELDKLADECMDGELSGMMNDIVHVYRESGQFPVEGEEDEKVV